MKKNKILRLKMKYIKFLLRIYTLIKNILPKVSNKLKQHIEKVSLRTSKSVQEVIKKNDIKTKR